MSSVAMAFLLLALSCVLAVAGVRELIAGADLRRLVARRTRTEERSTPTRRLSLDVDRRLRAIGWGQALARRIAGAGMELRVVDFVRIAAAAAVATFLLASLLAPTWLAVLAGGGAVRLCLLWIDRNRTRRLEAFVAQLPELARVLSNAVSAGLSLTAALELAVGELEEPAASELGAVLAELKVGQSLPDALERLEQRMPSRELGVLVSTLVIQQRAGGDAVRALHDMSETLETRKDLIREVRTVMAGSVFSAWVVAALGMGTVFLLNVLQPGVLKEMTSNPIGIAALVVAATLYSVGLIVIRRITRVDT